jgi:two-component system CheB/CheR fusion protein
VDPKSIRSPNRHPNSARADETQPPPATNESESAADVDAAGTPETLTSARFPIVGIGASAGGLEALQAIMRRIRPDRMAFVVVQHLSPVHESLLTELLGRCTEMPVSTVEDGQRVEPAHVYVLPANADILVREGVLHLTPADRIPPRLPIDSFLRSLASHAGTSAIGVILSGGGTDGTLGLKAIKAEGGLAFVQDPGTAIQPSMPQSALDSGCADFCLPPEGIADELMRLGKHPYVVEAKAKRALSSDGLAEIFKQLRTAFGVDFTQYKSSTLKRRIERRMTVHHLETLDSYVQYIHANPSELQTLYRDMLIGVTNFFRDRELFEAISAVVFPRIIEREVIDAPIRIWSAGCSTGEEPYSLAMCLLEHLGDKRKVDIQIFATDLDEDAVRQARQGLYRANIELDVSPERLHRFFTKKDDSYQISRELRDMVIFATQDLSRDPPFSRLDLVSCRNVLIYMQPPLQKKILRNFHYALNPDGFLVLGPSEGVGDAGTLFSEVDRKLKLFAKRNVPASVLFEFGARGAAHVADERRGLRRDARPTLSLQQIADRKVIERYGPPGVVIDDTLEILQFRGRTAPYLEPAPGIATLNLLKLARPELLMELRTTIHKAFAEGTLVTSARIHAKTDQGYRQIQLDVMPLHEEGIPPRCLLILFRDVLPTPEPSTEPAPGHEESPRLTELERELTSTRDFLETTIEELEAANEELKSANEELQSSNEELQSTNEELETSKEELQATNEELGTVNEELQNRMSELGHNNDDLENLLTFAQNPLVVVGIDLRIRRFSRSAGKRMNLIEGDVGRPVAHLRAAVNIPNLERMVTDVINTVTPALAEASGADGQNYLLRIAPYRTAESAIRGAVLEFVLKGGANASR